jgi:hypothetical protein
VAPTAKVYEVNSAVRWAELIEKFHIEDDGLLYPDWHALAEEYDGVHMTAAALLALQGLRLTTPAGVLAESYWDVESTVWLSWQFTSAWMVNRDE